MIKLLPKLFIKNYKNVHDPIVRNNYGKLAGIVGIITNLLLSITKILIGIISLSMAILADGLNNLSDSLSSIMTYIGFKIASKPADKHHPYGHQRFEYLTGLIVSIFIIIVGSTLLKSGIEKIIKPEDLKISTLTMILLGLSILIKVWQFFFYRINGKLIGSQALIATSSDSFNDVITTFVVLVCVLIYNAFKINIDGVMTLIVSIFIIMNGIKLVKETVSPLIGEAPDEEFIHKISNEIQSFKGVFGYHDLVVHSYGPGKTFITVHVEVDASKNILESHKLIDDIERYINEKYNTNLVIHMDPIELNDAYTIEVKEIISKIIKSIDPILNFHDFRVIKEYDKENIIFDLEVPDNYRIKDSELIDLITIEAKKVNPKFNLIIIIDVVFSDYE